MGRWQRTKDVDWWTKAKDDGGTEAAAAAAKAEAAATRAEEEILMQEALGLRPKRSREERERDALEKHELQELLRRGDTADGRADGERVRGLGETVTTGAQEAQTEVLAGVGLGGTEPRAPPRRAPPPEAGAGPPREEQERSRSRSPGRKERHKHRHKHRHRSGRDGEGGRKRRHKHRRRRHESPAR